LQKLEVENYVDAAAATTS